MAGGIYNPFGFGVDAAPQSVPRRMPQDIPAAPFGFAPPPSKMQQTLAILNEYNPIDAFWRLYDSPMARGGEITDQNIEDGLAVAGTVMGGGAMIPAEANSLRMGIKAYHGSPHSFDKFSMDKIGTGEGAQAYGHGLYFAESEGVAKSYRDALSKTIYKFNKDPAEIARTHGQGVVDTIHNYEGDPKEIGNVISGLRQAVKRNLDEFGVSDVSQLKPQYDGDLASATIKMAQNADSLETAIRSGDIALDPGSMYEVNIDADPNAFLDWDKPLSEQPAIRDRLLGPGGLLGDIQNNQYAMDYLDPHINGEFDSLTGRELNSVLSRLAENEYLPVNGPGVQQHLDNGDYSPAASGVLRNEGIPGIKYLDAGSRGAGDGTRNYVVFDDKLISIVKKYGIAGASAMLGYNILDGVTNAQAEQLKKAEGK